MMVRPYISQEDTLVRCSHTIAEQPLGCQPAQPPHPYGNLEAYLSGPLITQSHSTPVCGRAGIVPSDFQDLNTKDIHYGQNAPYLFSLLSPK